MATTKTTPKNPAESVLHPAIQFVIDEQLRKLTTAMSLVQTAELAVRSLDASATENARIDLALSLAGEMLEDIFGNLIPFDLEKAPDDADVLERMAAAARLDYEVTHA